MRIKSRHFLQDRVGETRVVRKFLWLPRSFGTEHWRWLEFAYIQEEIHHTGNDRWRWCEMRFATDEETKTN